MNTPIYRVVGVLLATQNAEAYLRYLDVADVAHDAIPVDATIVATAESAAADMALAVAIKGDYATVRWQEPPAVERVEA